MHIEDWRLTSDTEAQNLLEGERRRWVSALSWDPGDAWTVLEEARRLGTVPGFVARDRGQVVGWCFFVVLDGVLKIGALDGRGAEVVRGLLEAVLDAPETRCASLYQSFVFPGHPSVEPALSRRRFALAKHAYLERMLHPGPVVGGPSLDPALRPYQPSDLPGLVRLLSRAYAGDDIARCFAPHGQLDEWAAYVTQVIRGSALGRFEPACSWVTVSGREAHPDGGLLATRVAPDTLHIAQVAIDPSARGQGLGKGLVAAAVASAVSQGATRVTLLVAASNAPAVRLYRQLQFVERAWFLFGWRERPTRVLRSRAAPRVSVGARRAAG